MPMCFGIAQPVMQFIIDTFYDVRELGPKRQGLAPLLAKLGRLLTRGPLQSPAPKFEGCRRYCPTQKTKINQFNVQRV